MNKHINKNHPEQKWERRFLGKIKDFDSKEQQREEQRHLKCYMQGKEHYKWGTIQVTNPISGLNETQPNYKPVKQELIKLN